jgi:hypothetical protein
MSVDEHQIPGACLDQSQPITEMVGRSKLRLDNTLALPIDVSQPADATDGGHRRSTFSKALCPIEQRRNYDVTTLVDEPDLASMLYLGQAITERMGIIELRRNSLLSDRIYIAPPLRLIVPERD